jgi:disulfide bond formation protein DsbB
MKRYAFPIAGVVAMVVLAKTVNPIVEIGGIILAGAIGLGIGIALNSIVFREKKSASKTESDPQ